MPNVDSDQAKPVSAGGGGISQTVQVNILSPNNGSVFAAAAAGWTISVNGSGQVSGLSNPTFPLELNFDGQGAAKPQIKWGQSINLGSLGEVTPFTWSWRGQPPVSTHTGTSLTIEAKVSLSATLSASSTVTVSIFLTPPSIAIASPVPSSAGNVQLIAADKNGVTLTVSGTATMPAQSLFGLQGVTWQGTWLPGPPANGAAGSADGFLHWNVNIQVPPGVSSITFTCTDTGGNSQQATLDVEVALPSRIFGTEPGDYLQALIGFATDPAIPITGLSQQVARIRIGNDNATAKDATATLLQQTFGQLFGDLALKTSSFSYDRKANEQVHKIRLVIEVLRNLLRPPSSYPFSAPVLASAEQAYLQPPTLPSLAKSAPRMTR